LPKNDALLQTHERFEFTADRLSDFEVSQVCAAHFDYFLAKGVSVSLREVLLHLELIALSSLVGDLRRREDLSLR